jgi:nitrite reductase/ring-hydroxylating ferredoxin subunit
MARPERVIAESVDLVERGAGVRFDFERDGKRVPGFVIRANGVVRGYVNVCAHQGLELDWTPLKFFDDEGLHLTCTAHGALYDPADGRCVGGPCRGKGLERLCIVERDGRVLLIE